MKRQIRRDRRHTALLKGGPAWIAGGLLPALLAAGALLATGADPGAASAPERTSARAAVDTTGLASGPYARMQTLLERTIFQVDVAVLTLRYDSTTAARLRRAVEGREYSEAVADSVAAAVVAADHVHGHLEFQRDIGFDRFLESLGDNMENARDAGILADSAYRSFRGRLPEWYAALEERGVRDGDVTEYLIHGDSLQVLLRSADEELLIDRTSVGEQHRRAVLGGYLAPGGDFREGLVRSLFQRQESGS